MMHFKGYQLHNRLPLFLTGGVIVLMLLVICQTTNALRCYMDSSDPDHPGIDDCLQVDGQGDGKY